MKLEQNQKNLLFEKTEIPDIFFNEYLSMANGDFVKVYLYMLFLSKYNIYIYASIFYLFFCFKQNFSAQGKQIDGSKI